MPAATQHALTFDQAVEGYLRAHGQLSFLQIGGYDGVSYDPLRKHILTGKLTGVIVEPVPMHVEKLQALYAGSDRIKIENCAVDREAGERTMWFFSRAAIANGTIGEVFGGITSFLLPNLLEKSGTLGGLYNDANRAILTSLVESITVPCHTYDTVMDRHGLQRIDLLQIDTEGYDFELLKAFDFTRHRPAIVQYECQHLQPQDKAAAEDLLRSHGYVLSSNDYDTLALRGLFIESRTLPDVEELVGVATQLMNEGRDEQAGKIFRYALQVAPDNLIANVNGALVATRLGQHAEAMHLIHRATQLAPARLNMTTFLDIVCAEASRAFNDRLAAKDLAAAEPIIEGLALLRPEEFQKTALILARYRGNTQRMQHHAARMLEQNRDPWSAHAALSDVAIARGDVAGRLEHNAKVVLLRERTADGDEWIFSGEAFHVASDILVHPEVPHLLPLVDELRAAVAAQPQTFSKEEDRASDRFLRLCLDSAATSILTETPPERALPALAFTDSAGSKLTFDKVRQKIQAGGAKLTFLAAADEVYLRRYGRNYLEAVLQRCDVDCAVILCMIGDPKKLKGVIAEIGIRDPRLFYMVDSFDPVHAVSYYTPEECIPNCARAYYQSVRFLVLDGLLRDLAMPLIVTDIDILLQGSVARLLERHAGSDVVLNRNEAVVSFGSHFTANLVLVKPGPTGQQFAAMTRHFLEARLKRDHIEQFVDQIALVFAHYHCRLKGLDGFGFFQDMEINNLMFNKTRLNDKAVDLARQFVFFAYYGSAGESAEKLMNRITGKT
ncbi:MAG: FkbM family methyltransferase [Alphaproteobacteria bacterium]|nr:FkbM family methyltransferase [Alphaproteobacteria bacterium]